MEVDLKNILNELNKIKFPKCKTRKNVSDSSITAFCLGTVNYRGQKKLGGLNKGDSKYNTKFPELYKIIKDEMKKVIDVYYPGFTYTTIQINKNVKCDPHIDKNNVDESLIVSLGDYDGGELIIEGKEYDIKNKVLKFDGHKGHWTNDFTGDRYSLIFFTHTFKPPNPSLRNITITKQGMYKKGELIKKYV